MITLANPLSLPIATLRRLMRERSLDPEEKVAAIALLTSLDAPGGVIAITDDDLATKLGVSTLKLRQALGALWALGYLAELVTTTDGELQIVLGREAEPSRDGGND